MNKIKRIHITGPSGTGKTTLARELSSALRLPYITTSAKNVWPEFGIEKHADAFKLDDLVFAEYQMAVVKDREIMIKNESFITDRSPVDNLVYTMDSLASKPNMVKYIDEIKKIVELHISMYVDLLIYLPFTGSIELEDDGARITSPYYQHSITGLFNIVLGEILGTRIAQSNIHVLTYTSRDINFKVNSILNQIKRLENE